MPIQKPAASPDENSPQKIIVVQRIPIKMAIATVINRMYCKNKLLFSVQMKNVKIPPPVKPVRNRVVRKYLNPVQKNKT
jgi:hypothetical protein